MNKIVLLLLVCFPMFVQAGPQLQFFTQLLRQACHSSVRDQRPMGTAVPAL
jgi:hypothetical protein